MNDMVGLGNGLYLWSYHEDDGSWRGEITDAEPDSKPLHVETGYSSKVKMIGACARWLNERLNGQPAQTVEAQ